MKNKRLEYLDYAKAFAIIITVLIHCGFSAVNNYVLFAMPPLFLLAGYTYSPNKRTLKENIVTRFKSILIPFWIFMIIYIIVEFVRAPYIGYGDFKLSIPALINTVYGSGYIPNNSGVFNGILNFMYYIDSSGTSVDLITPTNPHMWFLPALFTACLLFYLITVKKKAPRLSNTVFTTMILVFLSSLEAIIPSIKQLPYGLGRGFMGAAFMLVGFHMKECNIFEKKKSFTIPTFVLGFVVTVFSMLLGSNGSGFFASYYGEYGIFSVYLTFLGGVGATYCILSFCKWIEQIPCSQIKRILSLVGKNTMLIYLWHMPLKFLFDILYLQISNKAVDPDAFYMRLLPMSAWLYLLFEVVAIIFIVTLLGVLKARKKEKSNCNVSIQ